MRYYKELEISNFDTIVKKSLIFVKFSPTIFLRKIETVSYYDLDFEKLDRFCPEIRASFLEMGLEVNYGAVYVMYDPSHTQPHRDAFQQKARINIPLLNCDNTFTAFYTNANTVYSIHPDIDTSRYYVKNTDIELVDQVEIKKTTVLRTSEVHNVIMNPGAPVPRINLSLGFKQDPVFLLED